MRTYWQEHLQVEGVSLPCSRLRRKAAALNGIVWAHGALVCRGTEGIIAAMKNLIIPAMLLSTASLFFPLGSANAAGDVAAGKVKAYTCTGCHGIPGYNNVYPTYKVPKIGGQNYEYLTLALKAYRDGERDHPTMDLQAQALSDQDIEDVAAYFASLGGE